MNMASFGIEYYHSPCNASISNNTLLHNGMAGIQVASGSQDGCSTNGTITIANNISDNNLDSPFYIGAGSGISCPANSILLENNLFNGNGNSNNIRGLGSCIQVTGSLTGEASATTFANYQSNGSGNYALKPGSLAIGGGTTACVSGGVSPCTPTTDILGNVRPSLPSIGAFDVGKPRPTNRVIPWAATRLRTPSTSNVHLLLDPVQLYRPDTRSWKRISPNPRRIHTHCQVGA